MKVGSSAFFDALIEFFEKDSKDAFTPEEKAKVLKKAAEVLKELASMESKGKFGKLKITSPLFVDQVKIKRLQ